MDYITLKIQTRNVDVESTYWIKDKDCITEKIFLYINLTAFDHCTKK